MSGNVWEWVGSIYRPYPYDPNDGREDNNTNRIRSVRGGSWEDLDAGMRSALRLRSIPTDSLDDIGFRCARTQ
jgi:formylglycine-generating enzyme required for sulfatase activity